MSSRIHFPKPSAVFDLYWQFAAERQRIFRARLSGAPWESKDQIIGQFRFTNAYRASDRVSQYLIRHVIYDRERDWEDVFLRVMIFKLFNKIATWTSLGDELGEIQTDSFDVDIYSVKLDEIRERIGSIYTAAYMMPSAKFFGSSKKHVNHLRLVKLMIRNELPDRLVNAKSAKDAFDLLLSYPSMGPFLAYQLLTDLSYSDHLDFQEADYVSPGPGALDGLYKCFLDPGDLNPEQIIQWTMESQEEEFTRRGIEFADLWGRPLQLVDCQNLFCEIGKYARRAFPEIAGISGRTRIKQVFRPIEEPISAWYPPKWGLNARVEEWLSANRRDRPTF